MTRIAAGCGLAATAGRLAKSRRMRGWVSPRLGVAIRPGDGSLPDRTGWRTLRFISEIAQEAKGAKATRRHRVHGAQSAEQRAEAEAAPPRAGSTRCRRSHCPPGAEQRAAAEAAAAAKPSAPPRRNAARRERKSVQ